MGLQGSTFYDTINKVLVGFLILLPWLRIKGETSPDDVEIILSVVSSWMVGLFFWAVTSYLFSYRSILYMGNNDERLINIAYHRVLKAIGSSHPGYIWSSLTIDKKDYLKIYYEVQKLGLLGNVGLLECFSAFFRNFALILVYWIILIFCHSGCEDCIYFGFICIHQCDCFCDSHGYVVIPWGFAIVICLVLLAVTFLCRKLAELQIHFSVIEAYMVSHNA